MPGEEALAGLVRDGLHTLPASAFYCAVALLSGLIAVGVSTHLAPLALVGMLSVNPYLLSETPPAEHALVAFAAAWLVLLPTVPVTRTTGTESGFPPYLLALQLAILYAQPSSWDLLFPEASTGALRIGAACVAAAFAVAPAGRMRAGAVLLQCALHALNVAAHGRVLSNLLLASAGLALSDGPLRESHGTAAHGRVAIDARQVAALAWTLLVVVSFAGRLFSRLPLQAVGAAFLKDLGLMSYLFTQS